MVGEVPAGLDAQQQQQRGRGGGWGHAEEGLAPRDEMSSLPDVMRKLDGLVATGCDRLGGGGRAGRQVWV